jgi:hypothetical protein
MSLNPISYYNLIIAPTDQNSTSAPVCLFIYIWSSAWEILQIALRKERFKQAIISSIFFNKMFLWILFACLLHSLLLDFQLHFHISLTLFFNFDYKILIISMFLIYGNNEFIFSKFQITSCWFGKSIIVMKYRMNELENLKLLCLDIIHQYYVWI